MILIGDNLRELRESKGLTQKQLGELLGVSAPEVSAYENDSRRPPYEVLVGYSRIFKVSTDFILGTERRGADPLSRLSHEHRMFVNELAEFLFHKEQNPQNT